MFAHPIVMQVIMITIINNRGANTNSVYNGLFVPFFRVIAAGNQVMALFIMNTVMHS